MLILGKMPKCRETMANFLKKCAENFSPLYELIPLEKLILIMNLGCNTTHNKVRKGGIKSLYEKITHSLCKL